MRAGECTPALNKPISTGRLLSGLSGLVSSAAAFAFAGIFAFAAVVAALATTLALARIHAFAGVFIRSILVLILVAHFNGDTSFGAGLDGMCGNSKRTTHQAGNRCTGNHCFLCHVTFLFRLVLAGLPSGTLTAESPTKVFTLQSLSALEGSS